MTGAAKRIGRSLGLSLAAAGADVAITYRGSAPEAKATVEELQKLKVRAMAVQCDVRNLESVTAAVAAVVAEFGRLDILVNNAGIFETAVLQSITLAQWLIPATTTGISMTEWLGSARSSGLGPDDIEAIYRTALRNSFAEGVA